MATIYGTWKIHSVSGTSVSGLPYQSVGFVSNGEEFNSISFDVTPDNKAPNAVVNYGGTYGQTGVGSGWGSSITWTNAAYATVKFIGEQTVADDFYNVFIQYATQTSTDIYYPTMPYGVYVGVSGKAAMVRRIYVGVDGTARRVLKAYVGDADGKARRVL